MKIGVPQDLTPILFIILQKILENNKLDVLFPIVIIAVSSANVAKDN